MNRLLLAFSLLLCFFPSSLPVSAQAQTGTPSFGSFSGGPDIVNNANLNVHIVIPVLHKPGRGTNFTYDLIYDSSIWSPAASTWQPTFNLGWGSNWTGTTGYISNSQSGSFCYDSNGHPLGHTQIISNWIYVDPWGISHPFSGSIVSSTCPGVTNINSFTSHATDGSGLTMNIGVSGAATIVTKEGLGLYPPSNPTNSPSATTKTDRNGNQITSDSSGNFYDTLSSATPVLTVTGSGTPASPIRFAYTDSSGNSGTKYAINYTNFTVATNFGVSGIGEYKSAAAVPLITSIVLPDSSQYTITYEPTPSTPSAHQCTPYAGTTCVTARIASVILPTGGTISYLYYNNGGSFTACSVGNNGIYSDGSSSCLKRTTPDGTWTYVQGKGSGAASTTTITAPVLPYDSGVANQTVIQFQGIYETQRKIYQGSTPGTLLSTVNTCYNAATIPCTATAVALPITQRTTQGSVPGAGNLISQHTDKLDSFGNLTESDEYDLATGAPFPLLRQTLITYTASGGTHAFTQTVTVKDGNGVVKSRQDTNYDQYSSFTGANCITGAPNHDDAGHSCTFTARANATSVTAYTDPVTPGGAITKNFTYDSLGNLRTAQINCCQLKTFNFSTTTKYAYPDSVVSGSSAPMLTTSFTYDLNMGLTLITTDPNNVVTTFTYDSLGRPLTAKTGTNPTTNYTYTDSGTWSVKVCAPLQGTNYSCQKSILDLLGRTITSQVLDASSTLYSATDTQYDPYGRAYRTSNPYTSSAAYWTQSNFDALGRLVKMTLADNSFSTATYTDNTVVASDPAGVQRKSVSDGLGRLTSVFEPDPTNGNALNIQTSYAYNIFDQLTTVTASAQTRSYTYDALGRALSSTTPEAGAVCFGSVSGSTCNADGYDSFDNLLKKTDARGVVTNYLYDSLNRLVGVTYPTVPSGVAAMPNVCQVNGSPTNNANVCFVYGTTPASFNNGRLASMTDPSGSESYTYDQFGNTTQLGKTIAGTLFTTSYSYNFARQLTQITYPSGRSVAQGLDAIGRLLSITGTLNSVQTTYASGYLYNAAQQMTGFTYGNNTYASFGFYADTLMLKCLDYSTTNRNGTCVNDGTSKFGLQYSYPASPSNNGRISGITDAVDSGRSASYTYDALYRLSTAVTTGSTNYPKWGLSQTYDRYGNRTQQTAIPGSCVAPMTCPQPSATVSATTNRFIDTGYAYDASGNMTNDGANTLTYDGEDRTTSAVNGTASGNYTYDGNGLRVLRVSNISGVTTNTAYIFSGGKVIAEYDYTSGAPSPSSPTREYVYSGGQRVAKIDSGGTKYYHQDHLSSRIVTDSNGNTSAQMGHFPFGESWYNASNDKLVFTTYERDKESGNDYAQARYYISRLGRFSSPDPLAGSITDPQSLNRYSYVENDPINLADPFGTCDQFGVNENNSMPNGGCSFGGGGGGGAGGGGVTSECNLDGVVTPCGIVQNAASSGATCTGTYMPGLGCVSAAVVGRDQQIYFIASTAGGNFYENSAGNALYPGPYGGYGDSGLPDPNSLVPEPVQTGGGGGGGGSANPCAGKPKLGWANFGGKPVIPYADGSSNALQHIYRQHMNPFTANKSQYVYSVGGAKDKGVYGFLAQLSAIIAIDAAVFNSPDQPVGTVGDFYVYQRTFTEGDVVAYNGFFFVMGSGVSGDLRKGGGSTLTFTLLMHKDCLTVRTSFPGTTGD